MGESEQERSPSTCGCVFCVTILPEIVNDRVALLRLLRFDALGNRSRHKFEHNDVE